MTDVFKTGGAKSLSKAGGVGNSPQVSFDPDNWLVSLFRSLKNYIESNVPGVYDIVGSFPASDMLSEKMPFRQTLIHFEIDDVTNITFGFGDNQVQEIYDEVNQTVTPYEVRCHEIDFDLGVWASVASGGVTSRLNAYQTLNNLFFGAQAFKRVLDNVGAEVLMFHGGSFVNDTIDDQEVFRIAGVTLRLRAYSRVLIDTVATIESFIPVSGLTVQEEITVDVP